MSSRVMLKNIILLILVLCCLSNGCEVYKNMDKARFDYYRLYRLSIKTDEHVKMLQELEEKSDSYTFYGHANYAGQELTIMVAAHKIAEITDILERFNLEGRVLENNIQNLIDAEEENVKPMGTPITEFDWRHYFHISTINKWLENLANTHSFIERVDLGDSYEGRPIRGLKLSKKAGNTAIFIEAGIHAREWISPATATYILNQLIQSTDPDVIDIANNFDWYFFPIVNPDGYKHSFDMDRLWRKNRKPYGLYRGVDLNRNFDSNWNGTGSSSDSSRYDFCGSSAGSEPEVAAIQQFVKSIPNLKTYLSLHSFSQLLMFPYGYTTDHAPNYEDLKLIGEKAVESLGRVHGTKFVTGSSIETIYPSSGASTDWAYVSANVPISYIFELRGPPESTNMFILPAEEILPTGEETLAAFVTILKEARALGYYN